MFIDSISPLNFTGLFVHIDDLFSGGVLEVEYLARLVHRYALDLCHLNQSVTKCIRHLVIFFLGFLRFVNLSFGLRLLLLSHDRLM